VLAGQNPFLAYFIIYLAIIFLGNLGAFAALWVAFQGALGAWGVPLTLIAGYCANLSGDALWYGMGRWLRSTRLGNWIKRRAPHHEKIEAHITQRGRRWMLFAKFAYGSNFPIIFTIGWTRMDFRSFFRRAMLAAAIWLPVILGLSYGLYSGLAPLAAAISTLKDFELLFLAALALFIIIQFALARAFGKIFGRNNGENAEIPMT